MPLLKGIKVNLISQWECKVHPEFPHPEAEGKHTSSQSGFHHIDVDETFEVSAMEDRVDKALARNQVTASVYIPSCSGARFWVRWSITEPAVEEAPWYFFKLLMNGRPVTSWGTNAYEKPDGHVMRGLFEPSERWNYKNEGTVYKNMGTESRPFMFAEEGFGQSVAIDGGLIEVQVFRAFGRKRKLAEPTDFRSQEAYGIILCANTVSMPSGGLLERPQDAKFYDWHLKDPKDSPYVRFKFHYRSWDSLQASELIPENHRRALLSPTPSVMKTLGMPQQMGFEFDVDGLGDIDSRDESDGGGSGGEADDEENWDMSTVDEQEEPSDSFASDTPWLTGVFDNSPPANNMGPGQQTSNGLQYEGAPIRSDPVKMGTSVSPRGVKKSASLGEYTEKIYCKKRRAFVDRPLPKIPQRSSSIRSNHSRPSSTSPRITPSLRSYVEKSRPSSPEAKVGVARALQVLHRGKAAIFDVPRKSQIQIPAAESTPPETSFEKSMVTHNLLIVPTEFTPPMRISSAYNNPKPLENSPLTDFFSQPNIANITVRKHKRSPGLLSRLSISGSSFRSGSPFKTVPFMEKAQAENEAPVSSKSPIPESEWMCRTPSPVKNTDAKRYDNMWSPSPGVDGNKNHEEDGVACNGGPAPVFNGGVLHKMKKGVGNGLKGMMSGSSASSVISGAKTNRSEEVWGPKRSFTESPISSIDGGSMGEKRSSDKERFRRKPMEWVDHVKNHRAFGSSMEEPNTQTGQMSFPSSERGESVEIPMTKTGPVDFSVIKRGDSIVEPKWI